VGDWVAISEYEEDKVLIHAIFPRKTVIEREAIGKQAVDRDFNINRIERYLTIGYAAGVKPIVVLNKTDLIAEAQLDEILSSVKERVSEVPIIPISN